ncbi:MAG TPA: TadE/TadG family type IV pilus assembly protein [Terracidiphilus sp.]|jgi:Flp pilus assembly protein TadG|nr:TadE/TadG family type IV pilus assembly protein [Terracidiphilus sp.]
MKKFIGRGMRHCAGRTGRETERRSIVRRVRAFCFGHEDGNSLVEFALTLPILMAVLMAIFEFGIAFNSQLQLTQAVGAGAQYLQTIRTTTTDPCQDTMTAIKNSAPTLKASSISLSLTMSGGSPVSGSTCSGQQSQLSQGGPVTVYATYPCNITIFGVNLGGLKTRTFSCSLTAQVTEYEY